MMYSEYVKERLGKNIIETNTGFVIYSFTEDAAYIEDVFVKKEYRRSGECFSLGDKVTEIAKSKGFKKLLGSVMPGSNGSTESMKMLLEYGFKLDSSTNNFILLKKDI